MSSGKITRFQNNVRVDGDLDLSNSIGHLTLSALSSAPSSPTVGDAYYNSTTGKAQIYQTSGWANVDGTAAGSLDAAYNGGASITVDNGAVTLTDTQTSTGGALLITKSGVITGATDASVFHINSTGAHDSTGTVKFLEISVGSETITTPIGIEVEMGANSDNALLITKGALEMTDGAVTLTKGALTLTAGALTLTAGNATMTSGDAVLSDGSLTITDADNANTFAVTNDVITTADLADINSTSISTGALVKLNANTAAHDGEVLEVISAGDATSTPKGVSITLSTVATGAGIGLWVDLPEATTGAKGISVRMDKITTSDMLYLDAGGGAMTGAGRFINCNDDDTEKFGVASDGAVTIAGTASGTDALTITAGDILVTSGLLDMTIGDLTLADGSVSITDADNAASLSVTNNTITTADALVDIASTSITTGALMRLNANTAAHDGEILELINAGDATSTGTGLSITMPEVTTGAATGILVTMAKLTTTGYGILVRMDAITTGDMLYLDNGGGSMTEGSGTFINCNDDNVSQFTVQRYGETTIAGKAAGTAALTLDLGDIVLTDTDSTTITSVNGTGSIVEIISGGAIGADKACLEIDAAGAFNADGSLLRLSAEGVTATNSPFAMQIDCAALDMGAINIVSAPTTNSAIVVNTAGALAADKAVVELVSNANACNADSSVLRLDQTHTGGAAFCMTARQDDLDVGFINFEGTASADENSPISTHGTGTVTDFVRCAINGTKAWIPVVTGTISA